MRRLQPDLEHPHEALGARVAVAVVERLQPLGRPLPKRGRFDEALETAARARVGPVRLDHTFVVDDGVVEPRQPQLQRLGAAEPELLRLVGPRSLLQRAGEERHEGLPSTEPLVQPVERVGHLDVGRVQRGGALQRAHRLLGLVEHVLEQAASSMNSATRALSSVSRSTQVP